MEEDRNNSWLDLLDSSNSSEDSKLPRKPLIIIEDCDRRSKVKKDELQIEFNDSENEKKFDKLVEEKKIKSPFKRHISSEKLVDGASKDSNEESKSNMENPLKRARKDSSESSSTGSSFHTRELEADQDVLDRRQKQIDYGKNTIGYDNYVATIPKHERTREHPKTPPRHLKYSRRAWEGLIKSWRKKLHKYDSDFSKEADSKQLPSHK